MVAAEMGCEVVAFYDVGVAGIHRLAEPLRALREPPVDVIVVAAGMDGALPSVVCGLVDVPVIGLPTPIGYGLGGEGVAALMTMLQTCAPGLTVVNIGNGVGAGATAALIANRVAAARRARAGDRGALDDRARPSPRATWAATHRPLVVQKLMYDGSKSYRWVGPRDPPRRRPPLLHRRLRAGRARPRLRPLREGRRLLRVVLLRPLVQRLPGLLEGRRAEGLVLQRHGAREGRRRPS